MRGSYSAALNTYNKALSLGADPMHPRLKIGVVYQVCDQLFIVLCETFHRTESSCHNNSKLLSPRARLIRINVGDHIHQLI